MHVDGLWFVEHFTSDAYEHNNEQTKKKKENRFSNGPNGRMIILFSTLEENRK